MSNLSIKEIRPQIFYYIRRRWYNHVVSVCDLHLSKKGKDPTLIYWKAFATGMSGNYQDALRQFEGLQGKREIQYPISLALIHFHKQAPRVDYDAVDSLNSELSAAEDVTKELGLCLAARFALFTGDPSLVSKLTSKILSATRGEPPSTPFELEASSCEQWVQFENARTRLLENSSTREIRELLKRLDDLIRGRFENAEIDLLVLFAKCKLCLKQTQEATNILNQVIAMYPWFVQALADKAMILASIREWDQCLDTAQRVLDMDSTNLDALQVVAVHAFTQESQPHDALQKLEDYDRSLAAKEPVSYIAPAFSAALFSNICCRQPRALQICIRMLERAQRQKLPAIEEARLLTEQANIHLLQGPNEYPSAMRAYRDAAKKDPESVASLLGMVRCQLLEGAVEDAEGQIELLTVMHNAEDLGAEFALLQAMMARLGTKDTKKHLKLVNDCKDMFDNRFLRTNCPSSWSGEELLEDYILKSPDFLLSVSTEYLMHIESAITTSVFGSMKSSSNEVSSLDEDSGNGVMSVGSSATLGNVEISPPVQLGIDILRTVMTKCPGFVCTYIELARCYATLGVHEEAVRSLHQCLNLQPNCTAALVSMAKVESSRQNTAAADRALEQALSCDFSIRSVTLFRLVRVVVMAQQGKLDEAIAEMEQVIALPDIRQSSASESASTMVDSLGPGFGSGQQSAQPSSASSSQSSSASFADSFRLVEDDRVGAYVTLSALYGKARRSKEANKVLSEAKVMFAGTPQEVLVLVAASQLAVEKNDYDSAVRMLDKISEDSPTFTKAQLIKAEILLNHNRDQEGYTQCFHQLVEREPSSKNYALLGEAYLRILNPEKAVEALEAAHRLDCTNGRLRVRIGRTLVATHEYHRAIDFYEQAIKQSLQEGSRGGGGSGMNGKSSESISLSHDLAKLFAKLDRLEPAIRVLNRAIHETFRDVTDYRQNVATMLLLADVLKKSSPSEVLGALKKANELQRDVLVQTRSGAASNSEAIEAEKAILSTICDRIGTESAAANDNQTAEQSFNEALQHNPQNTIAMLGLATLHRNRGDMEQCQTQCKKIISADPSHEQATVMLSESLFLGSDPDSAVTPLENLLKAHPNNYRALERLITLLRRAGKLEEVPSFLSAASAKDKRSGSHAGYRFCNALYARYTNDIGKAISEFNLARRDDVWSPEALTHMIELYLNPDQEGAWEEKEMGPIDDGTSENINVAEALLKELRPKARDPLRFRVLENYCLLATKQRSQIEKAMQNFIDMLEADQDYLPAILGMATGYMVEKNQHKARNLLKRVTKMEQSTRDGEDFTKANLLLAKFCVDKSKYDVAQELCKKCLAQDRSCSQAWEILGLAMEKEMDYEHASECYEKAWKLEFEASATVGFKLAFTYLKTKKFVNAIDVCETVLALYPDYPRIRDEILKKAQLCFRSPNASTA